jgi:broad specificity phosphatase PhoE
MSTLYVIRHGQASYGQADYDRLSPLGEEQARLLGAHLAEGPPLDLVFVGPRRRQRQTADHIVRAARRREAEVVAALDEYPAEAILRQALPELLRDADPEARGTFASDPLGVPTDPRRFQVLFERVMKRWLTGELLLEDTESFAEFAGRVRLALHEIMAAAGRGRTVAAVTSAGPTGIALQMALELSDAVALKQSWVVANTGMTEIKFRGDEMTLVAFNALPHLHERRLVTFR